MHLVGFITRIFTMHGLLNVKISLKSEKNTSTLHEDQYTFFIISRSVLLRMKSVSDKLVEKIKTTFMVNNFFFFSEIVPFMR